MIVLKSLRGPAFVVLALLPYGASGWDGYSPDSRPVEIPASAPVRQTSDPSAGVLDEAESLYRAGRWPAAMDAFQGIVAADPDNAHAWLRIGNLHQRRRQFTQAASAYRRAASLSERAAAGQPKGGPDTAASVRSGAVDVPFGVRARALINLAAVNLELSEAALAAYDREIAAFGPARALTRADAARESIGRDVVLVRRRVAARGNSAADPTGAAAEAGAAQGASIEYLKGAPSP